MKTKSLLYFLILIAAPSFGQTAEEQFSVYVASTDSYELRNKIDLLGDWRQNSSNSPMAMMNVEKNVPDTNGQLKLNLNGYADINDQSLKNMYPNHLKNVMWRLEDNQLYLISSDLGKMKIDVEWDSVRKMYILTFNQIRYNKFGDYANFNK